MALRRWTWATCFILGCSIFAGGCSRSQYGDATGALSPADDEATDDEATDEDELSATITSISVSGELCPVSNEVDFDEQVARASYGGVEISFPYHPPGCADHLRAGGQSCSSDPKCTVTMDIEVPPNQRIGIPAVVWSGTAGGTEEKQPVQISRTYAFAGGERLALPTETRSEGTLKLVDSGRSVFSPTCDGARTVRFTAELVMHRPSSELDVEIDSVIVNPSARFGTLFKACATSPKGDADRGGKAGEWCQGRTQRPCQKGLVCAFNQAPESNDEVEQESDMAGVEGTCVDPTMKGEPGTVGESCGGARAGCRDELVCWHSESGQSSGPGLCESHHGQQGAPCLHGTPSLDCAEGFFCHPVRLMCLPARGEEGDICGGQDQEPCQAPLFCKEGACTKAQGYAGDLCGSQEYPACRGRGMCLEGKCVNDESGAGKSCNTARPCGNGLVCLDGLCSPDRTPVGQPKD